MAIKLHEKDGYGQVEPNRISAQRSGEVFAQLPAEESMKVIENGMFLVYDQVKGKVRKPAKDGELSGLVYNEIILPDTKFQEDKDYAMRPIRESKFQAASEAYPRVYNMTLGDTFTTNYFAWDSAFEDSPVEATIKALKFTPGKDGSLVPLASGKAAQLVLGVVAYTTMPDGQVALKLVVEKIDQSAELV